VQAPEWGLFNVFLESVGGQLDPARFLAAEEVFTAAIEQPEEFLVPRRGAHLVAEVGPVVITQEALERQDKEGLQAAGAREIKLAREGQEVEAVRAGEERPQGTTTASTSTVQSSRRGGRRRVISSSG